MKIITVPNILSFLRLLIALSLWNLFFIENQILIKDVVWLIGIAYLTDFLDGTIARKFNQISELGKILDPIADKLLTNIILLFLARENLLPIWVFLIVLAKDSLTIIAGVYLVKVKNIIPVSNIFGKMTTFVIATTIILSLFKAISLVKINQRFFTALSYFIISLSIITGLSYAYSYMLKKQKSQKPKK